jgi:hypothetical protein
MKKLFTLTLILSSLALFAQKADTIVTNGGQLDVYYHLNNGEVTSNVAASWDIGFTAAPFDASIILNESGNAELYIYGTDTNAWNSVDTTGFAWENIYNSTESWEEGAFANPTSHPSYGWGSYNNTTRDVEGNKIFILKTTAGTYKQLVIQNMKAAGIFLFKIADLGGANTENYTITKADYPGKNFILFNAAQGEVEDIEPLSADWHLLFTRYVIGIPFGQDIVNYAVSGVKINKDLEVAQRDGMPVTSNDTNGLAWNTNITEIGSDWKSFNRTTSQYEYAEDRAYFVKDDEGNVWKIYFTGYEGGARGASAFNVEQLGGTASLDELVKEEFKAYPNPTTGILNLSNPSAENFNVEVVDVTGAVQFTTVLAGSASQQIDLNNLASGVYSVIFSNNSTIISKRVIVQ